MKVQSNYISLRKILTKKKKPKKNCVKKSFLDQVEISYQDIEVGVVLGPDKSTEKLFGRSRQIVFVANVHAGLTEHRDTFGELQAEWRVQELEGLGRELLVNGLDFRLISD